MIRGLVGALVAGASLTGCSVGGGPEQCWAIEDRFRERAAFEHGVTAVRQSVVQSVLHAVLVSVGHRERATAVGQRRTGTVLVARDPGDRSHRPAGGALPGLARRRPGDRHPERRRRRQVLPVPMAESGRAAWATSSSRHTARPRQGRSRSCRPCVAGTGARRGGRRKGTSATPTRSSAHAARRSAPRPHSRGSRRQFPVIPEEAHPRDDHPLDLRDARGPRPGQLLVRRVRQPRAPDRQDRRPRCPPYVMTATSLAKLPLPHRCNAGGVAVSLGTQ